MITRDWNFILSKTQYDRLEEWRRRVIESKRGGNEYFGAIGGEVTFTITPTGIGEFVTATCCGEEIDLSEV